MPFLIPLLAKAWKPLLAVTLILGVIVYWQILRHELIACKAERTTLLAESKILQNNNKVLQAAIDSQNAMVEKQKNDASQLVAQLTAQTDAAIARASQQKARGDILAAKIRTSAVPTDCAAAIKWGNAAAASLLPSGW